MALPGTEWHKVHSFEPSRFSLVPDNAAAECVRRALHQLCAEGLGSGRTTVSVAFVAAHGTGANAASQNYGAKSAHTFFYFLPLPVRVYRFHWFQWCHGGKGPESSRENWNQYQQNPTGATGSTTVCLILIQKTTACADDVVVISAPRRVAADNRTIYRGSVRCGIGGASTRETSGSETLGFGLLGTIFPWEYSARY